MINYITSGIKPGQLRRKLLTRLVSSCKQIEIVCKELPPLREGDNVLIQNQDTATGRPNKWDREGTIIAMKGIDQYLIKVHGSGHPSRPPKKIHFKGTSWHSMRPTEEAPCQQQQPSQITDDGPVDNRSQRSTRERRQRQFYDASTGDTGNPCG